MIAIDGIGTIVGFQLRLATITVILPNNYLAPLFDIFKKSFVQSGFSLVQRILKYQLLIYLRT